MSLGMAKGVDYASFCKLVKRITVVVLTQTDRFEAEVPVEKFWCLPIYQIQVKLP
jgi:hypothetical protein